MDEPYVNVPAVSVPGVQSQKKNAIPQSDLTPWILTLILTTHIFKAQICILLAS